MEYQSFGTRNKATDEMQYDVPQSSILPDRPGYNSQGKAVKIRVNQFKVAQAPMNDVYQYDVSTPENLPIHQTFQLIFSCRFILAMAPRSVGLLRKSGCLVLFRANLTSMENSGCGMATRLLGKCSACEF
jgi:hypothetical protein